MGGCLMNNLHKNAYESLFEELLENIDVYEVTGNNKNKILLEVSPLH